ncbi:hypothetical protein ACFL5O_10040 [Myxococcota bacterium]
MAVTVKLEQLDRDSWQVSLAREGRPLSSLTREYGRAKEIAGRAASLLPIWDTPPLEPSESSVRKTSSDSSPLPSQRYLIVDPTVPQAARSKHGDLEGAVLAGYASVELAVTFARDEIRYGNPNVVVLDRTTGKQVFPRPERSRRRMRSRTRVR